MIILLSKIKVRVIKRIAEVWKPLTKPLSVPDRAFQKHSNKVRSHIGAEVKSYRRLEAGYIKLYLHF